MGVDANTDQTRPSSQPARAPLVEAALFLAVGGSATLLNMIFYAGLVNLAGIKPTYSAALSFVLVVPFHFLSYARIVFPPDRVDVALLVRYVMALILSFALNVGLVGFYWGLLGAEPIPAQVLGLIPAILANYLTFKFFVFRSQSLRLPRLNATNILSLATVGISGITAYAAIVAMLMAAGPAPAPDTVAALRSDALHNILDATAGLSELLPGVVLKLNAILFGSAPSMIVILVTGMIGLKGLILAYASDRALVDRATPPTQRLAAALTVLAGVMVLHIAPADAVLSDGLTHAFIALGATGAALASSSLAGRLMQPVTAAIFVVAATIAVLSGAVGALVWLLAPIGLVVQRSSHPTGPTPFISFIAMLAAFAGAASLLGGTAAYIPLLLATLIAAALPALQVMSGRGLLPDKTAAIATLCIGLVLAAVVYGDIAAR